MSCKLGKRTTKSRVSDRKTAEAEPSRKVFADVSNRTRASQPAEQKLKPAASTTTNPEPTPATRTRPVRATKPTKNTTKAAIPESALSSTLLNHQQALSAQENMPTTNSRSSEPAPKPALAPNEWQAQPATSVVTIPVVRPTPVPLKDLDTSNEPERCSTYVNDIMSYLFGSEPNRPHGDIDFLAHQSGVDEDKRAILLNWMMEVLEEYNLSTETLFLSKVIVDQVLAQEDLAIDTLQLLGIAAMLIASKFEDIRTPHVREFADISDDTYTAEQIVQMEKVVFIQKLSYNLSFPTEVQFLARFLEAGCVGLKSANDTERVGSLATYFCERSILDYRFAMQRPSLVALSCVVLALYSYGHPTWTVTLQHYSRVQWTNTAFRLCTLAMQDCLLHSRYPDLNAVDEKFRSLDIHPNTVQVPHVSVFDINGVLGGR